MSRTLASIQTIKELDPIKGADQIELVKVLGWQCVAKKGEFQLGDKCIYFEIDALLPEKEHFEFLRKSCWLPSFGRHRLKTIRLRGELSQGLALPITLLEQYMSGPVINQMVSKKEFTDGFDLTDYLDVTKYDPPLAVSTGSQQQFNWPISRTDEPRIQSAPKYISYISGKPYIITVKLDGTSSSFILNEKDGEPVYHVCSRNLAVEEGDNLYWDIEGQYSIRQHLTDHFNDTRELLSIQGEICGPKIQKNPLGLTKPELFVFNIVNTVYNTRLPFDRVKELALKWGLQTVPVLEEGSSFSYDTEQLLRLAEGRYREHISTADTKTEREGIVIRSLDQLTSFKAISNRYLLKGGN